MIARVAALRSIRMEQRPNDQAVFVYDDPLPDNDRHAVVRGHETIPEEERAALLRKIEAAFARLVQSPP